MIASRMLRIVTYSMNTAVPRRCQPSLLLLHRCLLYTSLTRHNNSLRFGNYFEAFSLREKFDVDTTQLSKEFRILQSMWHPDKFAGKTKEEQDYAARESSFINQAYRTLKDPLKRSLYLLELMGHSLEEGTTDSDPEFLMEIMEINEKLAGIKSGEDMEPIKKENQAILNRLQSSFASAFDAGDFREARKIAARMKYYSNISDKVHHFERERGI